MSSKAFVKVKNTGNDIPGNRLKLHINTENISFEVADLFTYLLIKSCIGMITLITCSFNKQKDPSVSLINLMFCCTIKHLHSFLIH